MSVAQLQRQDKSTGKERHTVLLLRARPGSAGVVSTREPRPRAALPVPALLLTPFTLRGGTGATQCTIYRDC